MAHYEPPHQDLRCLQIQLFSSLVVKELNKKKNEQKKKEVAIPQAAVSIKLIYPGANLSFSDVEKPLFKVEYNKTKIFRIFNVNINVGSDYPSA